MHSGVCTERPRPSPLMANLPTVSKDSRPRFSQSSSPANLLVANSDRESEECAAPALLTRTERRALDSPRGVRFTSNILPRRGAERGQPGPGRGLARGRRRRWRRRRFLPRTTWCDVAYIGEGRADSTETLLQPALATWPARHKSGESACLAAASRAEISGSCCAAGSDPLDSRMLGCVDQWSDSVQHSYISSWEWHHSYHHHHHHPPPGFTLNQTACFVSRSLLRFFFFVKFCPFREVGVLGRRSAGEGY